MAFPAIDDLTFDEALKYAPPACSCPICLMMCFNPCMGTPAQARRIIEAGYAARMMRETIDNVTIIMPAITGSEGRYAPVDYSRGGRCTFFVNDRCQLHKAGLKPIEGVLAHHAARFDGLAIHEWVCRQWNTDDGRAVVKLWGQRLVIDAENARRARAEKKHNAAKSVGQGELF